MKYIGIDAHASTCNINVMNSKGEILDQAKIITNGRLLVSYVRSIEGPKKLTVEECELSHWIYGILKKEVNELIVCDPTENKKYKGAKTDKLDAKSLADLLRGNFLSAVYHDDSPREQFRVLMSGYEDLIDEARRFKNRYKSLFRRNGQRARGTKIYKDEDLLKGISRKDYRFVGERAFGLLSQIEKERELYVKEIIRMSSKFPEIKYLKSLPGIGKIQAAKIVSQVIDPKRFRNKYKFYAYCGLIRYKKESGGKDYGSTRSHGNRILKCVYKMAAHQTLKGRSGLRRYYDQLLSQGVSDKNARNAVSRQIAAMSLSLWRYKKKYDDHFLNKDLSSQA